MLKQFILLVIITCGLHSNLLSQDFPKEMKQQKAAIEAAYKKKKLTDKEYNKLLAEQDVIKNTFDKYNSDGYLSPQEKNRIASKLQRAANRLRRYQNNAERY